MKTGKDTCPLCVYLAPILDELAKQQPDVTFIEIDCTKFSIFYDVSRIPDVKFMKNGKILDVLI